MFLDRASLGSQAGLHQWDQLFDCCPIATCSESPEEGRVRAGQVVVFEGLERY